MNSAEKPLKISLVIPMKNESDSLAELTASIKEQTFQPDEIVLVDGGSTDNTIEIAERLSAENPNIKLVRTPEASPGKGRNIGIENARNEWIALTDAGIKLEPTWLENLVKVAENSPEADLIYGNFSPITGSLFERCAAISYVPALRENSIRGKSVASMLMKKAVWKAVGGFPDLRAAEDLMFMETAEKQGFKSAFAPGAKVYWQLRPNLSSTFQKFVLYSKHNVWAGRAWDWHYGVAKQYLFVLPFVVLAIFHSWFWLIGVLAWLGARTAKRILLHRFEYGAKILFNPLIFCGVALLVLTIDAATFIGWAQAVLYKNKN
jgi:glycosyltransferase involved in cell wall biosynthesis